MQIDVAELRDFYATQLGQVARRILARKIRARWPRATGEVVVGFGFATPFLASYRGEARHLVALMPETQGALVWPSNGPVLVSLVDERQLPIPDNSVDRLLIAHSLEVSSNALPMLRECWRILKPQGSLLVIVPNRHGIWAHVDTTPFGQGSPFSRSQIEAMLRQSLFTPFDITSALHMLPFDRGILRRSAQTFEKIGTRIAPALGGVLLVEARREMMAPVHRAKARRQAIQDLVTVRKLRDDEQR